LVVTAVLYGFISGGMVSLPPAIIVDLTTDASQLGKRMGFAYTVAAFGALTGNPVAGATRRPSGMSPPDVQREFQGTWIFAGSFMLLTTGCLVVIRYFTAGSARKRSTVSEQ
jgi:MFS family permease